MFVSVFSLFFVSALCNDIVEKVNALGTTWVAGNNPGFDKLSPSECIEPRGAFLTVQCQP